MPPRVLGEGIVVVLDVGGGVRAGTSTTFYTQAKKCIVNILQRKIFADKCRDEVGVVLFGTSQTNNDLASGDQYQNISVLQRPKVVDWNLINEVEELSVTGNCSGDWLDALVVALDLLHDPQNARFSGRKIVLMTDFSGEFSDDQTTSIISGLKNQDIDLSVIGPDIDDDDDDGDDPDQPGTSNGTNGVVGKRAAQNWNGKPKTPIQLAGEALVTRMVVEVKGIICSFDEAIPQLLCFEKRTAGSAPWNTVLDIGGNLEIPISGRIKVRRATIPTWKTHYAHDEAAVIQKEMTYHRHDDHHTEVPQEEVIPGYKYGTTLVPFSDVDKDMKYKSNHPRCLSVLGFTKAANVPFSRLSGDQVLVVVAREGDEAAAVAISAIIQGLAEMDMVAITRRIYNKNYNPVMGALFPDITKDYECLVWVALPFQEDIRMYTFPSLERTLQKLTEEDKKAVDSLITAMDLTPQEDDEDEELEPLAVLNPHMQHFFNVLTHRYIQPQDPIPAPATHVMSILETPERLRSPRDAAAPSLAPRFPTKRVAKKTKKDNENLFASSEESSNKKARPDDGDESMTTDDLTRRLVTHVTTATPVQDFIALLKGEAPNFNLICSQLGDVIKQLVERLDGSSDASNAAIMTKVADCLTTFRQESCGIDPAPYNKFMVSLKETVSSMSLRSLWDCIRDGGLGLIKSEENGRSSIGSEEADAFLQLDQEAPQAPPSPQPQEDDMEDLLDEM
ncbi:hypothetical protein Pcinc_018476 [Petrolisthes cinctipes]|uniref:VWFA domain-containing protein n=1 Tax=Petrolisthes cinctipes TaxID=88211 RepID=A0AAE1FM51_PETCI|nr:hypothetical protein Pcinc_018476 [Petrolisthes cinctipes]